MIDVSVIIPCTDRVIGLDKCLQSVLNQNYSGKLEVLLIENNSINKTVISNMVNSINDQRIKHVYMDKCENANWARNYGIKLSKGKFVAFLDSDDWWCNDHVDKCIEFINTGATAIYSGFILDNGFNTKIVNSRAFRPLETGYDFLFSADSSHAQTSSFFLEKSILDNCKWDEALKRNQDVDFFIRIKELVQWQWKSSFTVNVYWPAGSKRTYSFEAFKYFYNKHQSNMSNDNKAFYLYEILVALSSVDKVSFDFFVQEINGKRKALSIIKRIHTYSYSVTKFLCKMRSLLRKVIVI